MSQPRPLPALAAAAVATVVTLGTADIAAGAAVRPGPAAGPLRPPAAAPADGLPTADQLKAALLTAAELGPDFTEAPAAASPSPGSAPAPASGCTGLTALLNRHNTRLSPQAVHQETELDGPGSNPMVTEALTAEDPAGLTADLAAATDAFTNCHSLTFGAGTDQAVTFTVTPLVLGDRPGTPAVRLDGTLSGVRLNGCLGIERFGSVGLFYGFFQRDSDSPQLASLYYRAAVAKAERTLGTPAGGAASPAATTVVFSG
ncbi:hypothetical protein [Kitasatospora sp. NPDC087315]|uniref:hypothetical protein n=1 Tax=Kitasatospora sp. NPDC087315 TaxID=3364069 RepID=UPI0038047D97